MAIAKLGFCLFFAFAASVKGEEKVDDADVLVLTKDNFQTNLDANDLILVEFYAPWCGHCKSLAPEYGKAATQLLKNSPPVRLAKVDATVHSELASKYGVSGYPTLFVFRNGKETKYNGPRDADGIVSYMKKQVGPAAKELTTKEQIEALASSDPSQFAVVGFFENQKSQLYSSFSMISNRLRDTYIFGKVFDPALAAEYKVTGEALVAIQKFDNDRSVYSGSTKTSDVEAWIKLNSVSVLGECTEANRALYSARGVPLVKYFGLVDKQNAKQLKYISNRIKPLAERFREQAAVCMVDKKTGAEQLRHLGLDSREFAFIVEKNGETFSYDGKFDKVLLEKFVADTLAGLTPIHIRSEPTPSSQNSDAAMVVVGKTFDSVVNDPTKGKLLEFYAPWCGHCKSLAPKYDELAKKFKDNTDVVIAKIDATANYYDQKRFEIKGYPSLFWVPAGSNPKDEKYEGPREVADMEKFIKKKLKVTKKAASKSDL